MGKVTNLADKQKSEHYRDCLEYAKLLFEEMEANMDAGFSRDEAFVLVQLGITDEPTDLEEYIEFTPDE